MGVHRKITDKQIEEIRKLKLQGYPTRKIAEMTGINIGTVQGYTKGIGATKRPIMRTPGGMYKDYVNHQVYLKRDIKGTILGIDTKRKQEKVQRFDIDED